MSFSSKILRSVTASILVLCISAIAFGDTIRLKDGSIIKGKIAGFTAGKFTVVMGEGSRRRELTFFASEIESINFDEPSASPQSNGSNRTASSRQPEMGTTTQPPARVVLTSATTQKPAGHPATIATKNNAVNPITWDVKVLADNTSNGWTNTGWVVKKGQRIRIAGDGTISLGKKQTSSPSGEPAINDEQKLLKNVATGALIAVIGDDNNDFVYIGAEREFTATRDGALFLGINEGYLDDNSGSYTVKIEIKPDDTK